MKQVFDSLRGVKDSKPSTADGLPPVRRSIRQHRILNRWRKIVLLKVKRTRRTIALSCGKCAGCGWLSFPRVPQMKA